MEDEVQPDMAAVAALPERSQEDLLEAITQSIYQQPPTDGATLSNLGLTRAVPEAKIPVNLAPQCAKPGTNPMAVAPRLRRTQSHPIVTAPPTCTRASRR